MQIILPAVKKACASLLAKEAEKDGGFVKVLCIVFSPIIIAFIILSMSAVSASEHNKAAADLCFNGGSLPANAPPEYIEYIEEMQESFLQIDREIDKIDAMTEGKKLDRTKVKSVFFSLYYGEPAPGKKVTQKFVDCFVEYTEKTKPIEKDGKKTVVRYTAAEVIDNMQTVYQAISEDTEITFEKAANASEIFYVLQGGKAASQGDSFSAWLSEQTYLSEVYIGKDGFCSPFAIDWRQHVTSEFGTRLNPYNRKEEEGHEGMDISAVKGTKIHATLSGKVCFVRYKNTGYGYHLALDHGGGFVTLYAHCSKILVYEGQTVQAGDVIAEVGSTGRSTGNHLHFEVIENGERVNPRKYLP